MSRLLKLTGAVAHPSASVIFFHGLGGDPRDTWQRESDPGSFWPLWLAEDIPGLAIYSVDYEAPVSSWRGAGMHPSDRAKNLLARLLVERDLQEGPLILIGHSLGGLVIKHLLRTAESESHKRTSAASLIQRVKKVAFLATPHTGSGMAVWANRLRMFIRPSAATASMVRNDPNLRELNDWYRNWTGTEGIDTLTLVEMKSTRVFGTIVRPDSSDPGVAGSLTVPIDANHTEICKPEDRSSEVYVQVRAFVERQIEPRTGLAEKQLSAATSKIATSSNITNNITMNIYIIQRETNK